MMKIPGRYIRLADAFDEASRARSCESSGSEHSPDLNDLVNSFFEKEIREQQEIDDIVDLENVNNDDFSDSISQDLDVEASLKKLFRIGKNSVKFSIYMEVEKAMEEIGQNNMSSLPDFKRRLMARLRDRGFDAGLCKSKWQRNGHCLSGDYEYIDVNVDETRYMIEVSLAGQFTIARPTERYSTLLKKFPLIFISKPEELKKLLKLMCNAIRNSMKSANIHVPPWRRTAYLQAKWFGAYKRTTNEISKREALKIGDDMASIKSVGFVPVPQVSFYCREKCGVKGSVRVGNLAMALKIFQ